MNRNHHFVFNTKLLSLVAEYSDWQRDFRQSDYDHYTAVCGTLTSVGSANDGRDQYWLCKKREGSHWRVYLVSHIDGQHFVDRGGLYTADGLARYAHSFWAYFDDLHSFWQ